MGFFDPNDDFPIEISGWADWMPPSPLHWAQACQGVELSTLIPLKLGCRRDGLKMLGLSVESNGGSITWDISHDQWVCPLGFFGADWCWLVRLCVLIHDGWFHQCWSMIHFSITKKTNLLSIQCHKPSIGHSLAMLWWKTTHQMMMEHVFYNFFDISWHGGFLKWFEMGVPLQSSKSSDHFSIERWLGDLPFQETPIDP